MLTEAELAAIRESHLTPEAWRARGYAGVAGFLPPDPDFHRLLAHIAEQDRRLAAQVIAERLIDNLEGDISRGLNFAALRNIAAWRAARKEGGPT